jgi:hypothetical protein
LASATDYESNNVIDTQVLLSIDIVLDEVRRKINFQFEQIDGLVNKSGIILGIDGIIFTILITNLINRSSMASNQFLAEIALVPIFASLTLCFIPILVRRWETPPNINRLRDYYIVKDQVITKISIIDKCLEAIDKNRNLIDKLFFLIKISLGLLFIGLILLAVWIGTNISF